MAQNEVDLKKHITIQMYFVHLKGILFASHIVGSVIVCANAITWRSSARLMQIGSETLNLHVICWWGYIGWFKDFFSLTHEKVYLFLKTVLNYDNLYRRCRLFLPIPIKTDCSKNRVRLRVWPMYRYSSTLHHSHEQRTIIFDSMIKEREINIVHTFGNWTWENFIILLTFTVF